MCECIHLSNLSLDVQTSVCLLDYVSYLAEGVGLSIPKEVVSEPLAEWQQHDLDRQAERRRRGRRSGCRSRLR